MTKDKPFQEPFDINAIRRAFLASLLLFIAGFLAFEPFFRSNDDAGMLLLAKGVGIADHPDGFHLYMNFILGYFLKTLYTLFPDFPWYGCFLHSVLFLSTWALTALFLIRVKDKRLLWIAAAALFPIFFHFFSAPHFSAYSFLAGGAGALLLVTGQHPTLRRLGLLFLFLASLIRFEALVLACLTMAPYLINGIRCSYSRKTLTRTLRRSALLTLLFAAPLLSNWAIFASHPDWLEGRRVPRKFFDIVSEKMPDYGRQEAAFQSVGWSFNDYLFFIGWNWSHPKFSLEKMRALDRRLEIEFSNKWPNWTRSFGSPRALLLLGVFVLSLFIARPGHRSLLLVNFMWTCSLASLLAIFQYLPPWVLLPQLAWCSFLCLLHGFPTDTPADRAFRWGSLVPLLLIGTFSLKADLNENHRNHQQAVDLAQDIQDLSPGSDRLFLAWVHQFPLEAVPVFGDWNLYRDFRLLWFSWPQSYPCSKKMLSRFGLQEPLLGPINREDVYLITDPRRLETYRKFVEENGGMKVVPELCYSGKLFNTYRIHSTGAEPAAN